MNNFEIYFFNKYIPEGQEIRGVIHKHLIEILGRLLFWLSLAFIPAFLYYYSLSIKDLIPFYYLEIFLILIYFKVIYDIFDWYNDVWIITNEGIIDLEWSLFRKSLNNVGFGNIEGMGIEQDGFIDSLLKRGNLVIHKIGDDNFVLENVYKPLNGIDLIEELSAEIEAMDDKSNLSEERFNMIINTLGGIMEGYVDQNPKYKKDNKEETISEIEKYKDIEGTIDLR